MSKNVIPPMTHPLASYWEQPPTSEILIDDEYALMTQKTFHALQDYSASRPSGVYEGKMWKRHDGAYDQEFLSKGGKPQWLLCWFGLSEIGPGFCSNHSRKILIADASVEGK